MLRLTELKLPLDHGPGAIEAAVIAHLGIEPTLLKSCTVFKRGWDARKKSAIHLVYTVDIDVDDEEQLLSRAGADQRLRRTPDMTYHPVAHAPDDWHAYVGENPNLRHGRAGGHPRQAAESVASESQNELAVDGRLRGHDEISESASSGSRRNNQPKRPIVIGAGPCGLFAALILAEMGFRPIILERGKVVRERTKDTWGLWRRSILNPESNVQFGEGGAGTFSDGKLWSGVKDPQHLGRKVLTEFVAAGAPAEILVAAKPHIGTFRLVTMVESLRAKIEALGGEYRFESKVTDIEIDIAADGTRHVRGVKLADGQEIATDAVVLAIGHSARDVFQMLVARGVYVEPKPFSIGVRIEHPQSIIDTCRFGSFAGNEILGAADYKIVHHARSGRSVYSFCMCPGGTVVAAASEPGGVVTNGMSQYSRRERNANAGIVVGITPQDYPGDPLAGVAFQRHWEERAFVAGGSTYFAPAQRVGDFLARRASTSLGTVIPSYRPGVTPTDLAACLPNYVTAAIREALPAFERQLRGFSMADAVMTGVETRTSSPIRIRRDDSFQSLNTGGLYPAGEGAGYAGGIMSAGIDGIRVAEAVGRALVSATTRLA